MKKKQFWWIAVAAIGLFTAACSPSPPEPPAAQASQLEATGHMDNDEHQQTAMEDEHAAGDHMAGAHDVPAEAAAAPNPIAVTGNSVAIGENIYTTSCAVCHGITGQGDGPGAAGLEQPPANLSAGHVQGLSDGALFYIVTNGRADTPMPAWKDILGEEERWHVVNFLRTFNSGAGMHGPEDDTMPAADDEHHEADPHEAGSEHDDGH